MRSYNSAGIDMLDLLLASALLFGMPIYTLMRGNPNTHAPVDKRSRHRKSMVIIATFLTILLADWVLTSRTLTQIGLAAPTTNPAIAGCLFDVLVAIGLFFALTRKSAAQNAVKPNDAADAILPKSREEWQSFVIFSILAGFGWEVLYRGFLLFLLSPIIGLAAAVAASSIAYGLCHPFTSIKQMLGSFVSAVLFTTGYAATGNLWWLIILHMGLPLISALAASRRA